MNLKLILKVVFVAGLFVFLSQKGAISFKSTRDAFGHPEYIVPGFLGMFFTSILGTARWQWLLRAQGINLPLLRTLRLTLIGGFFNVALPGAVSGDFVKAYYVGKEIQGKQARAFGTILFDRIVGVSALALVSAGAMLFGMHSYEGTPMWFALKFMVSVSAGAVIAFYAYLFLVREHHDPLLRFLNFIGAKFPKLVGMAKVYEGVRHYHNHRLLVLWVLALSVVVHLTVGWACLNLARALGESGLSLIGLYVVVPLGLLITAVPVLPAGVGTGHAAFLYLFHLIGSERGADTYTLLAIFNVIMGAIGGLVYLRSGLRTK